MRPISRGQGSSGLGLLTLWAGEFFVEGAVLGIGRRSAVSVISIHYTQVTPFPSCDNQKHLQTLPDVS